MREESSMRNEPFDSSRRDSIAASILS